jgi:CHAT domain-containing protein/predicted negative regulator of RcsB-dependent stress response
MALSFSVSGLGAAEIPRTGEPIPLASGEVHFREVDLEAGEHLRMTVDQCGVDVVLRLIGPNGDELCSADSPNGTDGYEDLLAIVTAAGRYRAEVVGPKREGSSGRYVLAAFEHRPAGDEDRAAVAADRAARDAWARFKQGDYEAAIGGYRRALETFQRLGPRRRAIDALHRLCHAHFRLDRLPLATAFCDEALELLRAEDDRRGLDNLLDLAGLVRLEQGQPERAIPLFEEALALYEARGSERGVALALSHLGLANHLVGRTRLAVDAFERALDTAPEREEATIRITLGHLLLDFHRPREALGQYSRALAIHRRRRDDRGSAVALEGKAHALLRLGELDAAERALEEAPEPPEASAGRSVRLETLGAVRERRGDVEGARRAFEQAVELARRAQDRQSLATALTRLGRLRVNAGEPADGLRLLDEAAELFERVGDPRGRAASRVRAGEALRDLGRLEEAWSRIEPALGTIEALRGGADRRDLRLSSFAWYQEHFEVAIDVLMRLHAVRPEDGFAARAFEVHERRLARELRDTLLARQTEPLAPADPALVAEERRLLRELAAASLLGAEDPRRAALLDALLVRLDELGGRIRRAVTDAAAPAQAPTLDVAEIRGSLLDEDTVLLAYALGERHSYVWTLSRQGFGAHELPPRRALETVAAAFADRLARSDRRSAGDALRRGRRLADLLLAPVAAEIARHPRLVLVTEGLLQAVPFAALPQPDGADDAYLIRRHEIVTLPSASTLAVQRRALRPKPERGIALFADPVYGGPVYGDAGEGGAGEGSRGDLRRTADALGVDPFARLPHSRSEAERIRALYPDKDVRLALGYAARRETLLSPELASYAVLHFATHALVHPEHPELSGLVLSLVDEDGAPLNGFIRSFEIARLDLAAELVVLSACRTGVGRNVRGEGMQGLSRAFLDAGAARVVFSLWEVSDQHTAELMVRFYEALRTEGSPAAALRRAQVSYLAEPGSAPYQWAAFVLLGDWLASGFFHDLTDDERRDE